MISRREFLKLQALFGGSLLAPSLLSRPAQANQPIGDLLQCKGASMSAPPPFQEPLPIPPVRSRVYSDDTTDYYWLRAQQTQTQILPTGYPATPAWGFNGAMLGPTLRVKRNRPAVVYFQNGLSHDPITIHLHGSESPADSDGHPEDLIAPGNSLKEYYYPNNQPPATLWYHDHRIHKTAQQVYAGLAGLYIIEDDEIERELNLPKGQYDIPLVLMTRMLNDDGTLCFLDSHMSGTTNLALVNGKFRPYLNVARRKYRFRILNADNSAHLNLSFAAINEHGYPRIPMNYSIIATDTGYLRKPFQYPLWTPYFFNQFWLSPAERVEVVIDFSQLPIGARAALHTNLNSTNRHWLEFRVTHDAVDDSSLPEVLDPSYRTLTQADVTNNLKSRRVNLDYDQSTGLWLIDNQPFGAATHGQPYGSGFKHITDIEAGTVERWWFVNRTAGGMLHPMHVHACRFQVTRRFNGDPGDPRVDFANPKANEIPLERWFSYYSNPWEQHAWKDTTTVPVLSSGVEALVQFGPHRGTFVYHCHNLHHEDHDMMANMQII